MHSIEIIESVACFLRRLKIIRDYLSDLGWITQRKFAIATIEDVCHIFFASLDSYITHLSLDSLKKSSSQSRSCYFSGFIQLMCKMFCTIFLHTILIWLSGTSQTLLKLSGLITKNFARNRMFIIIVGSIHTMIHFSLAIKRKLFCR